MLRERGVLKAPTTRQTALISVIDSMRVELSEFFLLLLSRSSASFVYTFFTLLSFLSFPPPFTPLPYIPLTLFFFFFSSLLPRLIPTLMPPLNRHRISIIILPLPLPRIRSRSRS
ncbi:hypothetical protein BDQ17DRAFT_770792 [Cyathus striatus]|nr:hypothetical protein BDQ17DRAFT_770792 [Cyathus striatus]